jgi:hypothetical protein
LIARLTSTYITSSDTSVNSTLDNNAQTFPLGEKFYADFTHDDIIISVLTAMSVDYYKDPPSLTQVCSPRDIQKQPLITDSTPRIPTESSFSRR